MALEMMAQADAPIPLDVGFRVEPGELLALVGHSGSGKTTILRTIAGLWGPTTARVRVDGITWLDTAAGVALAPHRRRVGVVFQDYALFPHMTAAENVMAALDGPRAGRRVEAERILALVHLDGLADRRPAQLSGGEQQRVAVARALARRPLALLLDEPFSAVDSLTRTQLRAELAALRDDIRMPTLLVTHDLGEAIGLADRICVLDAGYVLQTAAPETLFARPATPRVAELLGGSNVFDGKLVGSGDGVRLQWGRQHLELDGAHTVGAAGPVRWYVPEFEVGIAATGGVSGERNAVTGQVVSVTPLGDRHACTVRCAQGEIRLLVPRGTAHAHRRPTPGETLTLVLPRAAIHIMA